VIYTESLLIQSLRNHLWGFPEMYNFGAVGDKDELIIF